MARFSKIDNEGLIVFGRGISNRYSSIGEAKEAANIVESLGKEYGINIELICCDTTVNWPDEMEYSPYMIGVVLFSHCDDGYSKPVSIPKNAFIDTPSIPSEIWDELMRLGINLIDKDARYLAITGWTWVRLEQNSRDVLYTSAEDDGFEKLENADPSKGEITMTVGYC